MSESLVKPIRENYKKKKIVGEAEVSDTEQNTREFQKDLATYEDKVTAAKIKEEMNNVQAAAETSAFQVESVDTSTQQKEEVKTTVVEMSEIQDEFVTPTQAMQAGRNVPVSNAQSQDMSNNWYHIQQQYEKNASWQNKAEELKNAWQELGVVESFPVESMNGKSHVGTLEGEQEKVDHMSTVYFIKGITGVLTEDIFKKIHMSTEQIKLTVFANLVMGYTKDDTAGYKLKEAMSVAVLKTQCIREGLVSLHFNAKEFHCTYRQVREVTLEEIKLHMNDPTTKELYPHLKNWDKELRSQDIEMLTTQFTDLVTMVAYVFWVRGHHYMDKFDDLYTKLWDRMQKKEVEITKVITWKQLACYALHAIYPIVLEDFWAKAIKQSRCNGALLLRHNSFPAGSAIVGVLIQGLADIQLCAPGLIAKLAAPCGYVQALATHYPYSKRDRRYTLSVNAARYGAKRFNLDDTQMAPIASVIRAAVLAMNPQSKLRESKALERLSGSQPITGAVLASQINHLSDNEELVKQFVEAPNEEQMEIASKNKEASLLAIEDHSRQIDRS